MEEVLDVLPGEGKIKTVTSEQVRIGCDECGEPAYYKHSYLLLNARNNLASSGYGKDDISWCSDKETYTCKECKKPVIDGYNWGATYTASKRFAHMFLEWKEKK